MEIPLPSSDHVFPSEKSFGLTTREYFAGQIMQGLAAHVGAHTMNRYGAIEEAVVAVKAADALIAELNFKETPLSK